MQSWSVLRDYIRIRLNRPKKVMKNLYQYSQSLGLDSDLESPKYKA